MNDFLEQMWPAFEAEVGEQLDALEQYLVRDAQPDIDGIFRQFHTIKSTSAMMDFRGMEAVAHAAEDLLDRIRRQQRPFDPACRDALLRAVDTLRRQLASAIATHQPPEGDPALVTTLRGLAGSGTTEAAAAPATTTAGTADGPLAAWLACSRAQLPAIALACAGSDALPAATPQLLAHAEAAGLGALAQLLAQLQHAAPDERLSLLAELLARQAHVEKLAGEDAGTRNACRQLRQAHPELVAAPLAAAVTATAGALDNAADAAGWLGAAERLLAATRITGLTETARVLRLARQGLREIEREARAATPELTGLLRLAVRLAGELDPQEGEDEPYAGLATQVLDKLQEALAANPAPAAAMTESAGLDARTLAALSPAARATLAAALQRGHSVVEIDADLEAMPDAGAGFIDWLSGEGHLLGSHTLFAGDGHEATTRLRFLAALPLPEAEIRAALAVQDPDGNRLQLHAINAGTTTAGAAPVREGNNAVATPAPAAPAIGNTLRVESSTLDTFVNRLGELVMLRNMMAHTLVDNETAHGLQRLRDLLGGNGTFDPREREQLLAVVNRLGQQRERLLHADGRLQSTLGQLQDDVLALRVVPVGVVFNRMTRVVRQVADAQGKQVQLDISGDDVRIDKSMVDLLVEPLTHMVRNAVDHGLETTEVRAAAGKPAAGTLQLSARQQGNAILVTVADDGRGLDHARILAKARALGLAGDGEYSEREIAGFVFAAGFSTAERVTEVSGRGVGMDVVRTRIAQIGGQIDVQSQPGRGTTFTLRLPLSVAIQNVVLATAGGTRHALPERNVNELLRLPASDVQMVRNQAVCLLRGQTLPLYRLDALLGNRDGAPPAGDLQVLVLTDGTHRIGIVVDEIHGRQEVFVRDIHPELMRLPGVGGAAILGDGQVIVIADCDNLMLLARRRAQSLDSLLRAS
ncbi:MAG: chemotaxis protein CheW [Pseudomonadota bacterium]